MVRRRFYFCFFLGAFLFMKNCCFDFAISVIHFYSHRFTCVIISLHSKSKISWDICQKSNGSLLTKQQFTIQASPLLFCLHQNSSSIFNDITYSFFVVAANWACMCARRQNVVLSRLNRLLLLLFHSTENRMRQTRIRLAHCRTYLHNTVTHSQHTVNTIAYEPTRRRMLRIEWMWMVGVACVSVIRFLSLFFTCVNISIDRWIWMVPSAVHHLGASTYNVQWRRARNNTSVWNVAKSRRRLNFRFVRNCFFFSYLSLSHTHTHTVSRSSIVEFVGDCASQLRARVRATPWPYISIAQIAHNWKYQSVWSRSPITCADAVCVVTPRK